MNISQVLTKYIDRATNYDVTAEPIPRELLDKLGATLEIPPIGEDTNASVIHVLARHSLLMRVPKELLTPEVLTAETELGYTPLHFMANNGELALAPNSVLTYENLSKRAGLPNKGYGSPGTPLAFASVYPPTAGGATPPVDLPVEFFQRAIDESVSDPLEFNGSALFVRHTVCAESLRRGLSDYKNDVLMAAARNGFVCIPKSHMR